MLTIRISLFLFFISLVNIHAQDRGGLTTLDKKPKSEPDEMTLALKKKLTYDWQLSDAFSSPISGWTLSLQEDGTFTSGNWADQGAFMLQIKPRPKAGTWDVEHDQKFKLVLKYSGGSPDLRLEIEFISSNEFEFKEENNSKSAKQIFSRQLSSKETTNKYHNKGYYLTPAFPWEIDKRLIGSDLQSARVPKSNVADGKKMDGEFTLNKDMSYKYRWVANTAPVFEESFWSFELKDGGVYLSIDKFGVYHVIEFGDAGDEDRITLEKQLNDGSKEFLKLKRMKNF